MALSRRTGSRFQSSIWPGFVDAMTGLLLVLMFVLTIFMIVQFVLTERITGQETELDTLAGEVAALAQALGLEERDNAQLEQRLGALNASLSNARDEAAQQAALIASLTSERDAQAAALDAAAARITGFEAQVAGLLAQRDDARLQIEGLETRQAELLSAQEALDLALASARDEVDAQEEAARLAAARREALDALVADLRARNAETEAQLAQTAEALSAEETARLTEAAAAEALRARLEDADAELTAMTLALERQRQEAEDTLTLLAAARAAEDQLDAQLAAALLSLQSAEQRAQTGAVAQEDLSDARAEIISLQARLAEVQTSLTEDRDTLRADLDDARQEIVGLTAQLNAAAETQAVLSGDRDQTAQALEEAQGRLVALQAQLGAAEDEQAALATDRDSLAAALVQARRDIAALEAQLEAADITLTTDREALREQLRLALAAKLAAQTLAEDQTTEAEKRAALLASAQEALAGEKAISAEAQRQTELLNQQVAALRTQLGELQSLLDDAAARDAAKDVQLQSLGSELNTALARVAAEQSRRAELEAAERKRLEEQAKDLEQYRSEFFGRLRDVLGNQDGVRIEGDRFVFSSEVLFPPGGAVLSEDGEAEIAKVARILSAVADDIPPEINWVIRVDGHTDNVPLSGLGEFVDNWELSQARALSVVKYMIGALGIPPDRLAANGFGQYQPVALGDSDEARAQNRRIELKFTEK
ncbi:peptidoglycan -binding protein [Sulfitobacter sp. TSTF-M16]|uniref:Peptidoglycan -binding protein n=1 Tax=Sulfitobacter aestuariivivens TaxID=2766981 RepID=A0A927D3N0_9RHOB|nr:peptidoglycan -binding protein [Sulfitobacter aestuariivivens]MBD3664384.1 peptidoglycan -binding protein [Sulfitobacter aestuariivivens]